jgi:CheY-like chemotaxis protein
MTDSIAMTERAAIVDDDQDDVQMLTEAIKEGYPAMACTGFLSSRKALDAWSTGLMEAPRYLFVDVNMPEMGGEELVKALRKSTAFRDTIIAAISTGMSTALEESMKMSGADFAFKKPYSFKGYSEIVEEVFHD